MKIIFGLFILIVLSVASSGQTPYMEGLKNKISSGLLPDTQRILLIADLAYATAYLRPDSGMIYIMNGMKQAEEIGFVRGQMYCRFSLAEIMWIVGEYTKANEMLLQTLDYAKTIHDSAWQIGIYRSLSACSRDQGNYEDALKYSFLATTIASHTKYSANDLGLCYLETGAAYQEMNKPDSAIFYLQQVILPDEPLNESGFYGFKFLMLGNAYDKLANDSMALTYYRRSITTLTGSNNYKDFAAVYNSVAKLYEKKNKPDSTVYYAKKGFDIAQNASFKKGVYESSLLLSRIYEPKDAAIALNYFKIATAAKDSMFNVQKTTQYLNAQFNEQMRAQQAEAGRINYRNRLRTYSLLGALGVFLLLAIVLYRSNLHKQKAKIEIEKAYTALTATQAQLIQSAKMASLGELTAGIAHEIQNPLNFINNFSEINTELIEELKTEKSEQGNTAQIQLLNDISENEKKINQHGKRADAIIKGMLQHSNSGSGQKELTDINALADEYLRLSYHGLRSKNKSFNAVPIAIGMHTDFDVSIGKINIIPQDIGRVLLNLYNNAFYAVLTAPETAPLPHEGGFSVSDKTESPTVWVSTKKEGYKVLISVRDNGPGIPKSIIDKIFQPFFTTKPTGQGTGLGLSLSYDIIKAHGGEIKVDSKEGESATFTIILKQTASL